MREREKERVSSKCHQLLTKVNNSDSIHYVWIHTHTHTHTTIIYFRAADFMRLEGHSTKNMQEQLHLYTCPVVEEDSGIDI